MFTKPFLGGENLNNFCQPSKGAGAESDPGILFPLLSYLRVLCQDALLWNNTKCLQKSLCKPQRPVEDVITLLSQPEFSYSRAAPASVTRGNTYQAENQQSQASSPSSSIPLYPSAEDNPQRAPYLPHRGWSHPQKTHVDPPTSAWTPANSLPSPVLGLVFISMKSSLSLCYKLFRGSATDRHAGGTARAQKWAQTGSVPLGLCNIRTMLIIPSKQHR